MPESMFVPMCEKLKFQVFKEDGQEGTMMNMGNRRIHPKSNRFHHRRTLYSSASARHERMSCRDATVPGIYPVEECRMHSFHNHINLSVHERTGEGSVGGSC